MLYEIQPIGTKCAKCGDIDISVRYEGDCNYWCTKCFANYYMGRGLQGKRLLTIRNAAGTVIHGGIDNV